jgi:hypothetical protein
MSDPVLRAIALAIIQMEKIMSAELDRLQAAVQSNSDAIQSVSNKMAAIVAEIAALKNAPGGIDPVAVDALASTLEGQVVALRALADTQV